MTQRVALGNLGGGAYGLKVSKAGVDVLSGADSDMMFDSRQGNTRIIMSGAISLVAGSNAARKKVNGVVIQLPAIDYEPLVWANFIQRCSSVAGGGATDDMGGKYFAAAWLGNLHTANPMDYANWIWDATNYRLTFNAETIVALDMAYENADIIEFRYIIFSSRNGT